MRVHLCSIIQTVHYIETQCVLIRHYVAKQKSENRNFTEQKTQHQSVFKAKKQNKVSHEQGEELCGIKLEETLNVSTDTV